MGIIIIEIIIFIMGILFCVWGSNATFGGEGRTIIGLIL